MDDETIRFDITMANEGLLSLTLVAARRGIAFSTRTTETHLAGMPSSRILWRHIREVNDTVNSYMELLAVGVDAVDEARDIFLGHSLGNLTAKGDRDMASEVDYAIERHVAAVLYERTPGIGFLGEETGARGPASDLTWTLDPVDGTVNFVHGSPLCGISLALLRGQTSVLGIVDLPLLGSQYTAVEGGGAFHNGKQIAVGTAAAIDQAVVAIGDYAVGLGATEQNRARMAITERLAASAQRVRMHGSAAIDLVWVAEGRVDGVIMLSNNPWDTAAGVVIAREAGAVVVNSDGSRHSAISRATIAANPTLLPSVMGLVAEALLGRL